MPEAQYELGLMYYRGEGVPQDYIQASKWVNLTASRLTGEVMRRFPFIERQTGRDYDCFTSRRSPAVGVRMAAEDLGSN